MHTIGVERLRILCVCTAAALLWAGAACGGTTGGGDDGSGGEQGVDVDLEIPMGDDYIFQLTEAVETSVFGQGSSRTQRNGRTSLEFTGVANDDENVSIRFQFETVEGETGTFETVQTSQLTHGRSTYKTDNLRVEIETYADGNIVGAMEGAFEKRVDGGSVTELSPPVRIAGRFDFEY